MSFLIKIFFLMFYFSYVIPREYFVEYTFNATALGYSGLLITWEPQEDDLYYLTYFTFNVHIAEEGNHENSKSDARQSPVFSGKSNSCSEPTLASECDAKQRSFKIHSLNESTLYEVFIEQYNENLFLQTSYSEKVKTSPKSQRKPAKPDFEYGFKYMYIKWYPCGKERICKDQESGTHFGVKIKELYRTRKGSELNKEELYSDFIKMFFLPDKVYEVVVYSVNGEGKTDSDSQEIFINPVSTPVQDVKIISLPDLSVLISWKRPKQFLSKIQRYWVFYFQHFNASTPINEQDILFLEDSSKGNCYSHDFPREQILISNRLPDVMYTYLIIPLGDNGLGFEYWMKHKVHVYNHDLPIAKPNFSYRLTFLPRNGYKCNFGFQWLPCGESFDCKNSRPGSNYSFQFKPELKDKTYGQDNGYLNGLFYNMDMVFEVTLKSSIEGNFSESVTKKFKNCSLV